MSLHLPIEINYEILNYLTLRDLLTLKKVKPLKQIVKCYVEDNSNQIKRAMKRYTVKEVAKFYKTKLFHSITLEHIAETGMMKDVCRYDSDLFQNYGLDEYGWNFDEVVQCGTNFEVFKYMLDIGYPFQDNGYWIFMHLAAHGTLKMIKYLFEKRKKGEVRRCELDWRTFTQAAKRGDLEIMEYMYQNDFPRNKSVADAIIDNALNANNPDVKIVKWLVDRDFPMTSTAKTAVKALYYLQIRRDPSGAGLLRK